MSLKELAVPKYSQQMQAIANHYFEETGEDGATARQIAKWAIDRKLWQPRPEAITRQCADDLARAMREEYYTDPQGRRVRLKHVARIKRGDEQISLWADLRTAPRKHIEIALKQRRQQIVGDCKQLKVDSDSFNDNRFPENPIQIHFDFRDDLAEIEAAQGLRLAASR